ncbi:hypothetical protein [Winogradskyella sp.]|jgi:hypothetical protein|uniref:beta strand repeat-containing protein n=1 Tax=Winogradskyella sp. TaxID=1883156 RepID=UPI0025F29CE2|nr:hypothetical protein [Winogradskyella sp.]MCT4628351.1 hypothetical protein [Winogradskyella sp.]
MKKIILLLTIFLLAFTSCNKDDETPQEQTTPQTFIKEQSEIMSVSTNSIILTGNQNEIESNDIIVSGVNNNAPNGFLRKVISKSNSNGNTIIQTQRVPLSEAIKYYYEDGQVSEGGIDYTFQPSDLSERNGNQIPITIPIDETITSNQGGVPIDIILSGNLTITPNIVFDITISNDNLSPNIEEFTLAITTENDFNVSITTQVDVSFNTDDIELGSFTGAPITITVGIPIVVIPKFTLYIGANGDLNASIVYTYNNISTATSGVTYNNGWEYLPNNGFEINNQSATATASVSGTAKAYIKPEFSLSLYDDDFVSSGISVEPYARFEGAINSTEYSWSINGGIDTGAFFNAQAFGFTLVDEEWNNLINIPEWEIASGGYNIATITNPTPSDNSMISNQPITFSWQPNDFNETPTYEILLGSDVNSLNSIGTSNNTSFEYSNTLDNGTYFWKVIARDSNNTIITESLIFSFALDVNTTVNPVNTPIPNNNVTDIPLNGNLSFTEGINTPTDATFKVYFDTNSNPTTIFNLDANTNTLGYTNLQEGIQYFWKVETISNTGSVLATSSIWSFTTLTNTANTEPVFNPIPSDNASDIELNGNLSFTVGANTPSDATYRLYFDTNTSPSTQFDLNSQTSYSYSNLQENTTYYWFVETLSNTGTVLATSNVWNFTAENNSSGGVYNGNLVITTQAQINSFNYSEVTGNLTIGTTSFNDLNFDITNLDNLISLNTIGGDLWINRTASITSLEGLNNVQSIGGDLSIHSNSNLTNIDALNNINMLGGNYAITYNSVLNSINTLNSVTTINGNLSINSNPLLSSINQLNSITNVIENLSITGNDNLNSLNGLNNISSVGGYVAINGNDSINSLTGLDNLTTIGDGLTIGNNQSLNSIVSLSNLTSISGNLSISSNNSLNSLNGLNNISLIDGELEIKNNNSITDLNSFSNLQTINGDIVIGDNNSLLSLSGLETTSTITGSIYIGTDSSSWSRPNQSLIDLCSISQLINNGQIIQNEYFVENNAYNPTYQDILDGNCSQ